MSSADDTPQKAVADPEPYRESLDAWMKTQMPETTNLRVHDVDMPRSTGVSNETVCFSTTARKGGEKASRETTRKWVARIEPTDGGLFPVQTKECEISCEAQRRIMNAVRESGAVPVPEMLPFERDLSFLGRPFFVLDAPRLEGLPTREEQVAIWEGKSGRKVADTIDYWEIFGAMRFDAIMIKLGDRMARAGIVPESVSMPVNNGTTDALGRLLERQGVKVG